MLLSAIGVAQSRAEQPAPEGPDEVAPQRTRITRGPGFASRIGEAALALTRPRTAEEALRLAPGVVVVQHGAEGKAHQLYLRGFDALHGADLEVELEGVRLNEAANVHATGYFDLALVPIAVLSDVRLEKGPFSLDQGLFGTAGTARYRLGVPQDRRGLELGYELGTTNRHRLSLVLSPEDSPSDESFLGGELVFDDGFGERRAVSRLAIAARVAPPPTGPDSLSLLMALGLARFELPGLVADADLEAGLVDFHGAYDDLSFGESDRVLGLMRHAHERDTLHIETVIHAGWRGLLLRENFTGLLLEPTRGDARRQTESRSHAGLGSKAFLTLSPLTLELHAGLRVDTLEQAVEQVDDLNRRLALARTLSAELVETWLAPGLRLELDALYASVGLRLVHLAHDTTAPDSTLAALPRLDLGLHQGPWTFRLAYGRGARPPDTRAALTVSDAVELGARLRVDRLEATLVGFFTAVGRESVLDHASGQSIALDDTRRLGLELQLVLAPIDPLRLRLDLTLSDARYDRSGRPVAGVPPLVASLQAEVDAAPWRLFLRALAVSSRPLPHGATGAGLFDLTLGAQWRSGPLVVALTVDNLLDLDQRVGVYHFASRWDPTSPPSSLPRLHFAAGPPLTARLTLELRP